MVGNCDFSALVRRLGFWCLLSMTFSTFDSLFLQIRYPNSPRHIIHLLDNPSWS